MRGPLPTHPRVLIAVAFGEGGIPRVVRFSLNPLRLLFSRLVNLRPPAIFPPEFNCQQSRSFIWKKCASFASHDGPGRRDGRDPRAAATHDAVLRTISSSLLLLLSIFTCGAREGQWSLFYELLQYLEDKRRKLRRSLTI